MLTPSEAALESTMERIARIMTKQHGVQVRIEGRIAYIDLETMEIVIPNLKGDAFEHIQGLLDGYLDHECGHAIYTDGSAAKTIQKDKALFSVANAVEDFWTEREHGGKFPGVQQNLEKMNSTILGELHKKWDELDPVNRLLVAMHECWTERAQPSDFYDDPAMGEVFRDLKPELRDGFQVKSTPEAIDLARRILAKIQDLSQSQEQPGSGSEGQQGEKSEGEGKQGEQQDPQEQKEGAQGGEQGPHQKPGQEPDSGDSGEPQKGPKPSPGGSRSQEPQEPAGEQTESTGSDEQQQRRQEQAEGLQEAIDNGFDPPTNAESFLNDRIKEFHDQRDEETSAEYLIFSEESDTEIHYDAAARMGWSSTYKSLREEVHGYIGNMSAALEAALVAEAEARWVGGARRGRRFDKRVLPTWAAGGRDDRIYRQKAQGEDWDTAVSLLWDCSGSMDYASPGTKSYLARLAAIAFHEALCRVNIVHEVLGFNDGGGSSSDLQQRLIAAAHRGDDLDRYFRTHELDNRMVFVPWGETDGRAICAINGNHANRDGECVMWAAKRLAARPETRKVLIVGSDGHPNGTEQGRGTAARRFMEKKYLQEVVKQIISAGIEVYAIGIDDTAVKKYYPQWVIINGAEDLPGAVMQQLAQALFARKGTNHG